MKQREVVPRRLRMRPRAGGSTLARAGEGLSPRRAPPVLPVGAGLFFPSGSARRAEFILVAFAAKRADWAAGLRPLERRIDEEPAATMQLRAPWIAKKIDEARPAALPRDRTNRPIRARDQGLPSRSCRLAVRRRFTYGAFEVNRRQTRIGTSARRSDASTDDFLYRSNSGCRLRSLPWPCMSQGR